MEHSDLIVVLRTLTQFPAIYTFIQEELADWIVFNGYYNPDTNTLTKKANDILNR